MRKEKITTTYSTDEDLIFVPFTCSVYYIVEFVVVVVIFFLQLLHSTKIWLYSKITISFDLLSQANRSISLIVIVPSAHTICLKRCCCCCCYSCWCWRTHAHSHVSISLFLPSFGNAVYWVLLLRLALHCLRSCRCRQHFSLSLCAITLKP